MKQNFFGKSILHFLLLFALVVSAVDVNSKSLKNKLDKINVIKNYDELHNFYNLTFLKIGFNYVHYKAYTPTFNKNCVNTTSTTNQTICTTALPYSWNGNSYNAAGTYNVTLVNAAGCDSVATLNLTTNVCCTPTSSYSIVRVCQSQTPYLWNNNSYTQSNTYNATLTNSVGCDSIATLDLIVIEGLIPVQYVVKFEPHCFNNDGVAYLYFYSSTLTPNINYRIEDATTNAIVGSGTSNGADRTLVGNLYYGTFNVFVQNCDGIYTLSTQFTLTPNSVLNCCDIQISGNNSLCINQTAQYTSNTIGGSWSSSNNNIANVTSSGLIVGISPGNCYIIYSKAQYGISCADTIKLTVKETSTSTTNQTICTTALPYSWNGNSYNAAGTYNVTLVNAAGCDSVATLNLATTAICCPTVTITNSSTPCTNPQILVANGAGSGSSIQWFRNGTALSTNVNRIYNQSATTVAGVTGVLGTDLMHLRNPHNVTIKGNDMYIADWNNHRVLKWAVGASSGTLLAGDVNHVIDNSTQYNRSKLMQPNDVVVDANDNLFIGEYRGSKVTQWNNNATTGSIVAGVTYPGGNLNELNYPRGMARYPNGNILVSDGGNDALKFFANGSLNATILAGSGNRTGGSGLGDLNNPGQVRLATDGKIYIADQNNNRILVYPAITTNTPSRLTATVVTNHTINPWGVALDAQNNIYVCETGLHRIVYYPAGTTNATGSGQVILGTGVAGNSNTQLNAPAGIWIDNVGRLFIADDNNHRIQMFTSTLDTAKTVTESGVYTCVVTYPNGCTSTSTINVALPSTSTTNTEICNTQFPYTWNGNSYNAAGIYNVTLVNAAGCDSIATLNLTTRVCCVTTYSTSNESFCFTKNPFNWNGGNYYTTGTYTIKLVNVNGCDSMATLNLTVNAPTSSTTIESACGSYAWNGTTYTSSGTYYFTTVGSNGCDSTASLSLTISSTPTITLSTASAPCDNPKTLTLNGLPIGASVQWFLNNQSTTFSNTSTTSGITELVGPTAANQINEPVHNCRDAAGNIYVAESANHRIIRIDATTNAVTVVAGTGTLGTSNSQLREPCAVSLDGNDMIITDHWNHRILRWTIGATSGTVIAGTTGTSGSGANELHFPLNAVIAPNGNLYVADRSNNRIQQFLPGSLTATTILGGAGATGVNVLDGPHDLDFISNDEMLITDRYSGRVLRYKLGEPNATVEYSSFINPYAIYVHTNGDRYITDVNANTVTKINNNSTTLNVVINSSVVNYPAGVTLANDGCIVVSDYGHQRVIKYCGANNSTNVVATIAGTYTATITSNGCTTTVGPLVVTMPSVEERNNTIEGCGEVVFNKITYTNNTLVNVVLKDKNGCDSVITHNNIVVKEWDYINQTTTITGCGSVTHNGTVYNSSIVLHDTTILSYNPCKKIAQETIINVTPWAIVKDTITKTGCGSVVFDGTTYETNTTLSVNTIDSVNCIRRFTTVVITIIPNSIIKDTVSVSGCESVLYNGITYTQNDTLRTTIINKDSCLTRHQVVIISVNEVPNVTLSNISNPCSNPQTIIVGGASAANITNIQWFRNGTLISNNQRVWTGVGVTVAGTTGFSGSTNSLLTNPHNVFVQGNNMFIADWNRHRILRWTIGATGGTVVAGGNGIGRFANQLSRPNDVIVDANGNMTILEYEGNRVTSWANGATIGASIAGSGVASSLINNFNFPRGLDVDAQGNLYVCDGGQRRIKYFANGTTNAIVVGGGTNGSTTSQTNNPAQLRLDAQGRIVVADQNNNRIIRYPAVNTANPTTNNAGVEIATGLSAPWGVALDAAGNFFVAETGTHRIVYYPANTVGASTLGTIMVGNATGNASNTATGLNAPAGIFVDALGRLFVADDNNHRIQMFDSLQRSINTTQSGTYTVTVTDANGCTSSATIEVNIPKPVVRDTNRINGCGSITFRSKIYTTSTTINDTLRINPNNCDSLINTTILTIRPFTTTNDTTRLSGCPKVVFNGVNYFKNDTIRTSVVREDSCLRRNNVTIITINPFTIIRDTTANTACGSLTVRGITYTSSTNITRTFDDSANCVRHIDVLVITIKPYKFSYDTVYKTGCDTLTYDGKVYTSTTTIKDTILVDENKCTAIVRTVNIIIRTGAECDCYSNTISLSTGHDNTGVVNSSNGIDQNWQITNGPVVYGTRYPQSLYTLHNTPSSWGNMLSTTRWISPVANYTFPAYDTATPFVIKRCICVNTPITANLNVELLSDNIADVSFDGVWLARNNTTGFNWLLTNKIAINQQVYLTPGKHCLQVNLTNDGALIGFDAKASITTLDGAGMLQNAKCCDNTGMISGVKYWDRNFNIAKEVNDGNMIDTLMPGFTMELRNSAGNLVATTVTDNYGQYSFSNLIPGNYTVKEVQQTGYVQAFPLNNAEHRITVAAGTINLANFGNVKPIKSKQAVTGCAPYTILGRTFSSSSMFQDTLRNALGIVTEVVDYTVIVSPRLTPTISISATQTQLCVGGSTLLSATVTNAGTTPTYQWFTGFGVAIAGATGSTFTATPTAASTTYYCVVKTSLPCFEKETATSNAITITINKQVTPTIVIATNSKTTICAGTAVTYFSTITNGGANPVYQWRKNGVNIVGANASIYTPVSLANGDVFSCNLTSNASCITNTTVLSNLISMTVLAVSPISQILGSSSLCVGSTIQLSNTSAGGSWVSIAGIATVNATGLVRGNSAGTATIRYTIVNPSGCISSVNHNITVTAIPATPTIGYKAPFSNPQQGAPTGGFCVGKIFGVAGSPVGGVWSSTGCISVTTAGIATINTTGPGSLTYTFTNVNGCSNFKTMTGTGYVCAVRGIVANQQIDVNNSLQFTMYPNPAKGTVTVKSEFVTLGGQIIITDLLGKTVKVQPMSLGSNIIDISNLSGGVYLLNVSTNEGKITKKLIIE